MDGKTYYVPGDMTYEEWKRTFVDGGNDELQEAENDGIIKLTDDEQWAIN